MNLTDLIKLATQAAQLASLAHSTIRQIRVTVAREHPADLAAFDAAVSSAREPWQQAAEAARADGADGTDD
jgi:hypothetical protein